MLIIDGDDDEIVPIDASAMLSFKLIKNTQHGMCTTLKDQVNEDLLAFIRALIMNAGCDCDQWRHRYQRLHYDGPMSSKHHVCPTLEVMVTVESNAMRKTLDPETGLALIDPSLANKEEK